MESLSKELLKDKVKEISMCGLSTKVYLKDGTSFVKVHRNIEELFKWLNKIKNGSKQ